jgi:hypothetical protein
MALILWRKGKKCRVPAGAMLSQMHGFAYSLLSDLLVWVFRGKGRYAKVSERRLRRDRAFGYSEMCFTRGGVTDTAAGC